MRFWIWLGIAAMAASPAMAGLLIGNNPNVSDGGLTVAPGAWSKTVVQFSGAWSTARVENNHDITPDDGGDWAVGGSEGSGHSEKVDAYYYQRFTVAGGQVTAGLNDIQLSGWSKAWAGWWSGENWNWVQEAHIELWVDGVKVFDGMSSNNSNRDEWALHQHAGTHNVTDHIEVRLHTIKGNDDFGNGTLGAIWYDSRYDDIHLFSCLSGSAECCPNALAVTSVSPNTFTIPPVLGTETFTIDGSNLDLVTAVQLTGPATINGTIITSSAAQITASFPLNNAPTGSYSLVLDRDNSNNCTDLIKTGAITINCGTPDAVVETIQHDRGLHGDSAHVVTLTGQNLAGLSSVVLRKSNFRAAGTDIAGTNLTMVGDDLQVTFDLTNAEGGRYDMVYGMNVPCADVTPASHDKSFLVYMPELTNGGFEEGYITPDPKTVLCVDGMGTPPDNPKAKHWDDMSSGTKFGGAHRRDGHVWGPDCSTGTVKNMTGQHYGGSDFVSNGVGIWTLYQTIAAPSVDAQAISTAVYNIRAELAANGGTAFEPVTIRIRLLDGTETDVQQVLAETSIQSEYEVSGDMGLVMKPEYNAAIPAGTQYLSDPPLLTIAFEFTTSGQGVNTFYGFFIDNVRNGVFIPPDCLGRTIWADNNDDGAVDMLDFADLQACVTSGLATPPSSLGAGCVCLDRDFNGQISEPDIVEFIKCATGPAVTWSAEAAPLCVP